MNARLYYLNGEEKIISVDVLQSGRTLMAKLSREQIRGAEYVDFMYDYFVADAGDEGFFVTNFGDKGTYLTRFTKRDDAEIIGALSSVGCYGVSREDHSILGIVKSSRCDLVPVLGVKEGKYYSYFRFFIDGDIPDEDIEIEYRKLSETSYSALAREYRDYQLKEKGCLPLKERCENDKRLKKAAESIEIRIRQGWKPVPSPVEEQTLDTEPPMTVACTFERVTQLAEAFKEIGVSNIEFCLVGWNSKGHDGRFPQIFPVEPELGGEEELKKTIRRVKELGYSIVCHDDATAAYRIADCFDEEYLVKNKDGQLHKRPTPWSGGRPYKICPKRQYERFEISNQEKIKALGFEGIHYIDVMTILPILKCYDKDHPLTRRESADWYKKTMELSRKNFGGFASESGYDYAAESLDYAIYADFQFGKDNTEYLCDENIPFWHIVYHGIILYNPSTYTLNYAAKAEKNRLKCIEVGGRPLVCYYANFASTFNWMGQEDFFCRTEEQLTDSVQKIKTMADDYELLKEEWYEYINDHRKIDEDVYETEYSNGTIVRVNYVTGNFEIIRRRR